MTKSVPRTSQKISARPNMATQVMNHIRNEIQDGGMEPGVWYSVYQISSDLNISRSPVRDGLLRLEEAGLIQFSRNRGFQVIKPQPEDIAEIFALRLCIEPSTAARAAVYRTDQHLNVLEYTYNKMQLAAAQCDEPTFFDWDQKFHEVIMEAGNSLRGAEFLNRLRVHTRLLSDTTTRRFRSLESIHAEHQPILEAIHQHDSQGARTALESHISTTGKLLLRQELTDSDTAQAPNSKEIELKLEKIWQKYITI